MSLFELADLPGRIAVVGGGPIGAEMGQALARLGARLTIVQRAPRLLEREDPDVSRQLLETFEREGIEVRLSAAIRSARRAGASKVLVLDDGKEVDVDEILIATGRRPVLEGLGLEAAGVAIHERGIVVDANLRTSQRHIFAAGDCTGGPQFTHWAEFEARIATRNALFVGAERRSMRVVPWVTFTDPEVARVGMTEDEARAVHGGVHVHGFPFARVDRALTEGDATGFAKIVVDRKERVLGAHLIGPRAGEALGEWVLAMENHLRVPVVARAIHVYPTMSRINRRVADGVFLEHRLAAWMVRVGARFTSTRPEDTPFEDAPKPTKRWATWVLGLLLLAQGLGKAHAPTAYVAALAAFALVPRDLLWPVAIAWLVVEIASGAGLLVAGASPRIPRWTVLSAAAAVAVSVAYAVMTTRAYALGLHIENCTCFGKYLAQRLSPFVLAQDAYMLLYSGWQLLKVRRWVKSSSPRSARPGVRTS